MEDIHVKQLTLTAVPGTDFWRKPPGIDSSNAPTHVKTVSSRDFHRARVTVTAPWTRLYDQGGLFIFFPSQASGKRCWLKTGIEFFHGRPNVSTVAAREWADWSLNALDGKSVTIEVEREEFNEEKGTGSSLFVYTVVDGKRLEVPIREITWAFAEEGEMSVGVYAARPTAIGDGDAEELEVKFDNFTRE